MLGRTEETRFWRISSGRSVCSSHGSRRGEHFRRQYRVANMLIEFVGCSGAGKTTHIERALRVLSDRGRAAACSTALVARATRTAWISNLLLRNICLNVVLFPWLLLALRRHARFFFFGIRHIVCRADSALGILQRSLSQARNLAANELL